MRIVYVTASLPYGRGESFVIPEIQHLQKLGHSIIIIPTLPRGPVIHNDIRPFLQQTLTRSLFSLDILQATIIETCRNPGRVFRSLSRLVGSRSVNIFLKNLAVFPKGLWVAQRVRQGKADHIHAHWTGTSSTIALTASEVSGIPWSFTAHRWDIAENNLLSLKAKQASFARFIDRRGREIALEMGIALPEDKTLVLHMGVERPECPPIRSHNLDNTKHPIAMCAAEMIEIKGHRYLLEALALLRARGITIETWLAGQGELSEVLTKQAESLGLMDCVRFLGQLSHTEVMRCYAQEPITFVVLPSLILGRFTFEGIPVSLIEAMAHRIPVIATETGGIPELLEGGAGLLVPPANPAALADAIERLITTPSLQEQLAEQGRQRIEDEFSIEVIADQLARLFATNCCHNV